MLPIQNSPTASIQTPSPDTASKLLSDLQVLELLENTFFVELTNSDLKNKKATKSNKDKPVEIKTDRKAKEILKENPVKKTTRKVSSTLSESLKNTAVKVGVVAGKIFFGLFALTAIGVAQAAFAIKAKIMAKIDPHNLEFATENMKKSEEAEKFAALKQITEKRQWLKDLKRNTGSDLLKIELKQEKLARFLLRALTNRRQQLTPKLLAQVKKESKKLNHSDFTSESALQSAIAKQFSPEIQDLLSDDSLSALIEELSATKDLAPPVSFRKTLQELDQLLKSSPTNLSTANQRVTGLLREALRSPVYQSLKDDPNNSCVRFLHALASGVWNNVQALDAYQTLGKATLRRVSLEDQTASTGKEMHALLKTSYKKAAQELLTDHGIPGKILYALRHPAHVLGSMASVGGVLRTVASSFGRGVYDSHYLLSNNPSLQGTTRVTLKSGVTGSINNCYGGSPTIGDDEISPEFEALCQAAENKRMNPNAYAEMNIPNRVYYTNFQNIESRSGEGARSRTIMLMNERYPLSFTGITLSKDSDFYMMRDLKKNPNNIRWEGAAAFGQEMMQRLTQDACFDCTNRMGNREGSGFYFPESRERWEPVFEKCIEAAQRHFNNNPPITGQEAFALRGAFQEYVYSMIQAYVELQLVKEAGTSKHPPTITAIRACKENIDRGGAENTKYMYTRLSSEHENRETLIAGVFQSRALSARNRVILEHRLPQLFSFMDHVEPKDFQIDMLQVMHDLGISFADQGQPQFTPALNQSLEVSDEL